MKLGAVKLDKKTLEVKSTFSALIQPRDYPILPKIETITGISPSMVADKPYFDAVAKDFINWFGPKNKSILAGWGLYYDLPLLRKEFDAFGLKYRNYFIGGGLDIKALGFIWLAKNGHSTTAVSIERMLKKLEIDTDFQLHRALDDAKATAALLMEFVKE